ncbi:hypothetical protein BU16DRAFT_525012 [Lophium mytilinum]|uniref:Uncharacterized protein n=1 Tax=Lophium mytilinum TaxID=390894 RepID=A0A6A6QXX6_9PEZI|nr:hypothetical protein BU16DRAFT_525012 [Lophium mytilinum]
MRRCYFAGPHSRASRTVGSSEEELFYVNTAQRRIHPMLHKMHNSLQIPRAR